jgi:hypothetical protein
LASPADLSARNDAAAHTGTIAKAILVTDAAPITGVAV